MKIKRRKLQGVNKLDQHELAWQSYLSIEQLYFGKKVQAKVSQLPKSDPLVTASTQTSHESNNTKPRDWASCAILKMMPKPIQTRVEP